MIRHLLILMLVLWGWLSVDAQQTPLFSQYFLNPYLYNPASVGQQGRPQAFFHYRRQWTGVEGAPETEVFTMDGKLSDEKWGVGLTVTNDVTNVIGRVSGAITGAYTVALSETQDLSFGMSAMLIQNRIYFDRIRVNDISDPNLLNSVNNKTAFDMNAGVSYRWRKMRLGGAVEQLLQNDISYEDAAQFQALDYQFVRHYIATLGYDLSLNERFTLKPLVLTRIVEGITPQLDMNVILDYENIVWMGVAYRHEIGIGASMGFFIDDRFVVGYSYDYPTTDLSEISAGSHEFTLGVRFNRGNGRHKNVYVSTEPKMTNQRKNDPAIMREEDAVQYEKMDQLEELNKRNEEKLKQYEELIDRQNNEIRQLKELYVSFEEELEVLKEDHEVKEGELANDSSQYYLIVGSFRTFENAKQFQKVMKRETGQTTRITQNNQKTWYLIYTEELKELSGAQDKIKALEDGKASGLIVGNPWIFVRKTEDQPR